MLDSRINQNFNRPIANPQFRASQNVSKPAVAEEKQGLSTTAKWAIGLGLTALASYGIYALTKGRAKGVKPTPEIKEMAIDVFKKDGRFEKGRAILKDRYGSFTEGYTGNITSVGKDGSKVVMEYVDGVLQKSTKTAKDGTKIFDKAYTWAEDGLIKEVKKNGETILDENKLIEIYKKANVLLHEKGKLHNKYPNVVKNLEEINANIEQLKDPSDIRNFRICLDEVLRGYGYEIDNGKIVPKNMRALELKNGLIELRAQNKDIRKRLSLDFGRRFSKVLVMCQRYDLSGTGTVAKQHCQAVESIERNVANILYDFGYKFENFTKNTADAFEIEKQPVKAVETVHRAIVDKNGNLIQKGKVFAPMDF